jgi:hypothetical protein
MLHLHRYYQPLYTLLLIYGKRCAGLQQFKGFRLTAGESPERLAAGVTRR